MRSISDRRSKRIKNLWILTRFCLFKINFNSRLIVSLFLFCNIHDITIHTINFTSTSTKWSSSSSFRCYCRLPDQLIANFYLFIWKKKNMFFAFWCLCVFNNGILLFNLFVFLSMCVFFIFVILATNISKQLCYYYYYCCCLMTSYYIWLELNKLVTGSVNRFYWKTFERASHK